MSDHSQSIQELRSDDPRVVANAAQALAQAGTGITAAAVPLARAAGIDDPSVSEWVAAALEELGPPAVTDREPLQQLVAAHLQGQVPADSAYWAVTLLGRLGEAAAPACETLAAALDEPAALSVRQRAAWALSRMGPVAAPAREALEKASRSDDRRLSRMAGQALKGLRREEA